MLPCTALRLLMMLVIGWNVVCWHQRRTGEHCRSALADLPGLALFGVCGYTVSLLVGLVGLHATTAFSNSVLLATAPLCTALLLWGLRYESMRRPQWLGMGLAWLGVLLFPCEASLEKTASSIALREIVGAVKKVSDIIAEIAAASQEQSSGIEQVNQAITQMDEITQQNAALVEEAAAASESLDALMDFFKTDEENDDAPSSGIYQLETGRMNGTTSRTGRTAGVTNGAGREPAPATGRPGRMPAAKTKGHGEVGNALPARAGMSKANGHAAVAAHSNGHSRAVAKGDDDEWSEF